MAMEIGWVCFPIHFFVRVLGRGSPNYRILTPLIFGGDETAGF
jgi:hypothetical protein